LQEKKQTKAQQEQAANAIKVYFETLGAKSPSREEPLIQSPGPGRYAPSGGGERLSIHESRAKPVQYEKSTPLVSRTLPAPAPARNLPQAHRSFATKPAELEIGASWKAGYARLVGEIKVRHYSSKTLQTYRGWVQHFQIFLRSKAPESLSPNDVKANRHWIPVGVHPREGGDGNDVPRRGWTGMTNEGQGREGQEGWKKRKLLIPVSQRTGGLVVLGPGFHLVGEVEGL
jgi:hypothetical protein